MKTNRPHLLGLLEQVQPGLSSKEVLEQSSCFVFHDGLVSTFNDELCCRIPCDIGYVGAVSAAPMLAMLSKLPEDEIDIFVDPEKPGEIRINGKSRRAGIVAETEIRLPVDKVETPKTWNPLPADFVEGLEVVVQCASKDEDRFRLTCVHIHPDFLEACDNFQIARFPLKTGVRGSILIRASSLKPICDLGIVEYSETRSWLHFRTATALMVSVRKHIEDYADLSGPLNAEGGIPATLPAGLAESVDKAEVFSKETLGSNNLIVELSPGVLILTGEGATGWYKERKKIAYDGPPIKFLIAPKLLVEITKKRNDCTIAPGRLRIDGGKFVFVTSLGDPETK